MQNFFFSGGGGGGGERGDGGGGGVGANKVHYGRCGSGICHDLLKCLCILSCLC